ncbi:FAD-binding oxidoreductase [Salipiger sp. P9]|uniref:NAD(P)/FAD-dependent oxidoreductase n=1 Tax=Salipiger pentaromativorans TaxID=2943193 RepID=UPI0021571ACA|nr:FAD-dependent oxidoreductase [Salipiger pentaromativorans]MCR8547417.1 FAD-binding oxidoreductase [Salipiger pentaromativorans]
MSVIVLGAGMVGIGSALALQARGHEVTVIDRRLPGSETSHGNAGIIQGEAVEPYAMPRGLAGLTGILLKRGNDIDWNIPGVLRNAPALAGYWLASAPARHREISRVYARLIRRATADHAPLIEAAGAGDLVRREGFRNVHRDAAGFEAEARDAERLARNAGLSVEIEDGAALATAVPALRRPMAGAVVWKDAWPCRDPGGLVRAYADLFTARGGRILTGDALSLAQTRPGWRVASDDGAVEAAQVVVALGPWSPALLARFGYRIRMVPKRGYHAHLTAAGGRNALPLDRPLMDVANGAVFSPMRGGLRILTGADLSSGRRDPATAPQLDRAVAAARDLLELGPEAPGGRWTGVRPCMPDMLPLTGPAPRHTGLWFNFGHGHQGFTLGPTSGALLAARMAGETDPALAALDPTRLRL